MDKLATRLGSYFVDKCTGAGCEWRGDPDGYLSVDMVRAAHHRHLAASRPCEKAQAELLFHRAGRVVWRKKRGDEAAPAVP